MEGSARSRSAGASQGERLDGVPVQIHRGARICSAGHGGQVLVSHTTHDLVAEKDAGFVFADLGEHRLKDLAEPQRLFQLMLAGLPERFPPLRTLENRPTNLPVQPTALVGRDREVAEVVELPRRPRDSPTRRSRPDASFISGTTIVVDGGSTYFR